MKKFIRNAFQLKKLEMLKNFIFYLNKLFCLSKDELQNFIFLEQIRDVKNY